MNEWIEDHAGWCTLGVIVLLSVGLFNIAAFSMILKLSILGLVLGIGAVIYGGLEDSDNYVCFGFISIVGAVVLGFLLLCINYPVKTDYIPTKDYKYVKTNNSVIVWTNDNKNRKEFEDVVSYNNIDKLKEVYIKTETNSYGCNWNSISLEKP